jgi:hypothetical protein
MQILCFSLDNAAQKSRSYGVTENYDYGDTLHFVQAYVLGYWYQLLFPLLHTSQLATQETFGF